MSEAIGWGIVPPTILRDGPFGEGMVQAFVEADPEVDVVAMVVEDDPRLRRMAVLDAVMNNTDRKGGHILPVDGGRHVYGVDHGVSLLARARSCGPCCGAGAASRSTPDEIAGLERVRAALDGELGETLAGLLSRLEVRATARRADALLAARPVPLPLAGLAGDPLAAVLILGQAKRRGGRPHRDVGPAVAGGQARPKSDLMRGLVEVVQDRAVDDDADDLAEDDRAAEDDLQDRDDDAEDGARPRRAARPTAAASRRPRRTRSAAPA